MTLSHALEEPCRKKGGFSSWCECYSCCTICWGERGMKCCSIPAACPDCIAAWWLWSPGLHCGPSDVGTPLLQPHISNGAQTLYSCPLVSFHLYPEGTSLPSSNCGPPLVQETQQTSLPSRAMITVSARRSCSSHGGGLLLSLFFLVSTSPAFGTL